MKLRLEIIREENREIKKKLLLLSTENEAGALGQERRIHKPAINEGISMKKSAPLGLQPDSEV